MSRVSIELEQVSQARYGGLGQLRCNRPASVLSPLIKYIEIYFTFTTYSWSWELQYEVLGSTRPLWLCPTESGDQLQRLLVAALKPGLPRRLCCRNALSRQRLMKQSFFYQPSFLCHLLVFLIYHNSIPETVCKLRRHVSVQTACPWSSRTPSPSCHTAMRFNSCFAPYVSNERPSSIK